MGVPGWSRDGGEDGVRRRRLWGSLGGEWSLMGKLLAMAMIPFFSAAVLQLRRDPPGAPGHDTEGKTSRVSVMVMVRQVRAREEQGREQHGVAVSSPTSGAAARKEKLWAAAASLRSTRPSGGVRERVE